jgi:Alpha-2-macroglobulin bait region domain
MSIFQIDIKLSKDQAHPGEAVEFTVKTAIDSFVGLLGVDQSVLLLKSGNDIVQSSVDNDLAGYNAVTNYNSQWSNDIRYTNTRFTNFASSSMVIITNAKKEYREWREL